MDLRQLRSFLAVIDHGSFSAAAEALFTVQSNVSAHVAKLEAEFGVTLLDRRTRELTPAGRAVERHGRDVLRHLTEIADDLAALEDRVIGVVAIGATPSIGLWVIPPTVAVARRELPEVSVTVVEGQSDALVQQLLTGEIDLALTTGASNPDVSSTPLFEEDIVAVFAHDHPLAGRPAVSLRELADQELLLPLHDNPLYAHIARSFEAARLPLRVGLEVGSSTLVSALAGAGVGVALVPATVLSDHTNRSVRTPITGMAPRGVALTTRSTHQLSRAGAAIRTIIERTARETAASMPGCHPLEAVDPGDEPDVLSMA
jgi:LysR family hydrogen peroxide-inducible transcriptional activator